MVFYVVVYSFLGSQKSDITERDESVDFEDTLASIEPIFVPLQGIKIGIGEIIIICMQHM